MGLGAVDLCTNMPSFGALLTVDFIRSRYSLVRDCALTNGGHSLHSNPFTPGRECVISKTKSRDITPAVEKEESLRALHLGENIVYHALRRVFFEPVYMHVMSCMSLELVCHNVAFAIWRNRV